MQASYAELHCISNFSFLRGASHPHELVERALALGYTALAITDECSFAGAVRAHLALRALTPAPLPLGEGLTSPLSHAVGEESGVREREFRLIRPLVFVGEDITSRFAESLGAPIIPCACSERTGTVRKSIRSLFGDIEKDYPHLKETMLSAMGNLEPERLLDPRYLDLDGHKPIEIEPLLPILSD